MICVVVGSYRRTSWTQLRYEKCLKLLDTKRKRNTTTKAEEGSHI